MYRLTIPTAALAALIFMPATQAAPDKAAAPQKTIIKIVKSGDGAADVTDADVAGALEKCQAGAKTVDSATETKGQGGKIEKTRIIICSNGGDDETAHMRSALESARERLSNDKDLSSDARAKALSAIDEQLNRIRAQPVPGK